MKMRLLATLMLAIVASQAQASMVFSSSSYNADVVFQDALGSTTMTVTYDGSNYWSSSGGSGSGTRYARYDSNGVANGTYAPGLDFRSVFVDNSGVVLARAFNNNTIYKQSSPGVFGALLTLSGGSLDAQSSVDMNDAGQFVANNNGLIDVWSNTGVHLSSFSLSGYVGGGYPANRGVAAVQDYLFTYLSGTLSAWDYSGTLLDTTTLTGAGASFDSNFSLSYANDRVFIVDEAGGRWRGFNVGLATQNVPEPTSLALAGLALVGLTLTRKRRNSVISAS